MLHSLKVWFPNHLVHLRRLDVSSEDLYTGKRVDDSSDNYREFSIMTLLRRVLIFSGMNIKLPYLSQIGP